MLSVTLDSLAHYVWPYLPDWSTGLTTRFRLETDRTSSLTHREGRNPLAASLRLIDLQATYILGETDASATRNVLRILQDTPVRIPFLPSLPTLAASAAPPAALWYMAFDTGAREGAVQNLYWTDDPEGLNGRACILPTLLGYLAEPPSFRLLTTESIEVSLRWSESSPYTERLQLDAVSWTEGPAIGARTIYRFPFNPDFGWAQDAGPLTVDVDRRNLGFTRQPSAAAYPQIGSRTPRLTFTLNDPDPLTLLRFFQDHAGPTTPFWLPCWLGECRLAADVSADDTEITVTDADALGDHRYLLLFDGTNEILRHITDIDGDTLTLDSAPGVALQASSTVLSTIALARFSSSELSLKWSSPACATAEIAFDELPQEYITPAGETYGSTIGPLPESAYLYELKHGAETWRYTSYERDLTYSGTWTAAPIDHSDITDAMAWDNNSCSLKLRSTSDNPLLRLATRTTTDRFELIIRKAYVADPIVTVTTIFRGWITSAEFDGPWITATCAGFGSLFGRNVPRTILQRTDNYALFDPANALDVADWTFTATLTAQNNRTLTFEDLSWDQGALPDLVANYFALGYVIRPAPSFERIPISSSLAIAAGVLVLTLTHAPMQGEPDPPEEDWLLIPGYDGLLDTATDKFDNAANFGGFPLIPEVNPSLVPLARNTSTSSKK